MESEAPKTWTHNCVGCHREREGVRSRRDHGERMLCDACAARPRPKLSAVGIDDAPSWLADHRPKPKGSLLPSAPPEVGAQGQELREWLTLALGLDRDPVASATRYGRHDDARLVVVLDSGTRIVFDRQADAFKAENLRRRLTLATGLQVPAHYGQRDAEAIAAVIVRFAETIDHDDDRFEAAEWARTFLAGAEPNTITVAEVVTGAGRFEAVASLARWKPVADAYATPAERSVLVLVEATGERWARASDVAAHIRALAGRPLSWASLRGRLVEVGWEHRGEMHQRQPKGEKRVKVHVYVIPSDWEDR